MLGGLRGGRAVGDAVLGGLLEITSIDDTTDYVRGGETFMDAFCTEYANVCFDWYTYN